VTGRGGEIELGDQPRQAADLVIRPKTSTDRDPGRYPPFSATIAAAVAAIGRPGMITREFVKPGATVIDVGMNKVTDASEFARLFGGNAKREETFRTKGSTLVGDVLPEYAGFGARYVGEGIRTYFGWPAAHEDDAERAVRAALEIVATVKRASSTEALCVRIGSATGPVVVGEPAGVGDQSKLAVGSTPNLAARLQSIAEPGGIVVSYETFALAGDVLAGHSLPPITMKGISREVIPYSVDNVLDSGTTCEVIVERITGLDFYLDPSVVDAQGADRIRSILSDALDRLDQQTRTANPDAARNLAAAAAAAEEKARTLERETFDRLAMGRIETLAGVAAETVAAIRESSAARRPKRT